MNYATKIPLQGIEKYEGFNLINEKQQEVITGITNQIEEEIKKRIAALGVDVNDADAIKRGFEFIEREGDNFKHLFYRPMCKFIISIQKVPTINITHTGDDFKNNEVTCTCAYKYY